VSDESVTSAVRDSRQIEIQRQEIVSKLEILRDVPKMIREAKLD
jgi:hypothetical protein